MLKPAPEARFRAPLYRKHFGLFQNRFYVHLFSASPRSRTTSRAGLL